MTHDFATSVFKNAFGELLPSSGKVTIGNNVYFGMHCSVLKGVTIGDNCIIGYGSTVIKDIPANSVAVGTPARVICTLEEYYQKRKVASLKEALALPKEIEKAYHRKPEIKDFREEFVFFVSGDEVDKYPQLPIKYQLTVRGDCLEYWKSHHKAIYHDFGSYLEAADIKE